MLVNDCNHVAAHGLGAVMGSKQLKAIVAWGRRRPRIHDRAALIDAGRRWRKTIEPYTEEQRRHKLDQGGVSNFHNWRSVILPPDLEGHRSRNEIRMRPCFQCSRLCPWDIEIGEGAYAGTKGYFNAGGEWMDVLQPGHQGQRRVLSVGAHQRSAHAHRLARLARQARLDRRGRALLEPIPDGQYEGFTIAQWLPELIQDYYRLSGRHETSGRPFRQTLEQMGLEEFSQWAAD